jgi:hypothetical protein
MHFVFFVGRWTTTAFLAALAIAASVKPEDAVSNISGWATYLHLPDPEWIQSHSVDQLVFWSATVGLIGLLGSWAWKWLRRKPLNTTPKAVAHTIGNPPTLKIETGTGSLFDSFEVLSSGKVRKASKIAVTNAFDDHLSNCRVQIKYINPHPDWHLPQKLHLDTFSLAAGESKYLQLASFLGGDKIRVALPPSGTSDYDPDLPAGRYVMTLEATADQIKPVEAFVSVSVDGAGQLQVQDALSMEALAPQGEASVPLSNLPTWFELERRFKELEPELQFSRIDGQTGSSGEYWRIAGGPGRDAEDRFNAVAAMASARLFREFRSLVDQHKELASENDPAIRWYKALQYIAGRYRPGHYGRETNDDGSSRGFIYTGTIERPATASATLCLEFASRAARS